MIRTTVAAIVVAGLACQAAHAQQQSIGQRQTWPSASPISRINTILNESSPSDGIAATTLHNPRYTKATPGITVGAGQQINQYPQVQFPISGNIKLDDEEHMQEYMKEYEVKRLIQQRAQRERDLRQWRMENRKFYGISLSRPTGSPMMFGGMYAPNWAGGFHYAYGFQGQYPRQQLYFQY